MKNSAIGLQRVYRLASKIETHFNVSELRELCLQLNIDYENLPLGRKADNARELVLLMNRTGRIPKLLEELQQLRPHVDFNIINIQELAMEVFSADDLRLQEVQSLIDRFRSLNERLNEWKELHDSLDTLLIVFSQYAAQVERFASKGKLIELETLADSWRVVHRDVDLLLTWAQEIEHIGNRYQVHESGEMTGELWAVELSELRKAINEHLHPAMNEELLGGILRNQWQRMRYALGGQLDSWRHWWFRLRHLTRELDDAIRRHMHLTDKQLRRTAGELYDLSKETLWS